MSAGVEEVAAAALVEVMQEWHGAGPSLAEAAAYIAAIRAAERAAGYVVVPVEANGAQVNAGAIAALEHRLEGKHRNAYSTTTGGEVFAAYRAMLAAATPPRDGVVE